MSRISKLARNLKILGKIDQKRAKEYAEVVIETAERIGKFNRTKFLNDCELGEHDGYKDGSPYC